MENTTQLTSTCYNDLHEDNASSAYYQDAVPVASKRQEVMLNEPERVVVGKGNSRQAFTDIADRYKHHDDQDDQFFILQPKYLKDMILERQITVKLAPTLLFMCGLPDSKKTTAVKKLFEIIKPHNSDITHHQKELGIGLYELLAARNPLDSKIVFASARAEKTDNSLVYYGVEHIIRVTGRALKDVNVFKHPSPGFKSPELNDHFQAILEDIHKHNTIKKSSLTLTDWDQSHASGIALINIWDIGLNKIPAYLLRCLSGIFHNSYAWIFLDLIRDVDHLFEIPEIPENRYDKSRNDKEMVLKWRSRIRYLLSLARLGQISRENKADDKKKRYNTSKIIASLKEDLDSDKTKELHEKLLKTIKIVSRHLKVNDLIDTQNICLFKSLDHKADKMFIGLLEKIIHKNLNDPVNVPLSFILLRTMFYKKSDLYISKKKLQEISEELKISPESFEEFCRLFTSFGSIIDMSLIDLKSDIIILKPVEFLNKLDKLFYYQGDDKLVTKYGLVTEVTLKKIFNDTNKDAFMSFLKSMDLSVIVSPVQCSVPFDDTSARCLVNLRTVPSRLKCHRTSLHFIHETSVFLIHHEIIFTSKFLQLPSTQLIFTQSPMPINISHFRLGSVSFELVYLGDIIEFRFADKEKIDRNVCKQIIRICHEIMREPATNNCRYSFAVMCEKGCGQSLFTVHHVLPFDKRCDKCCADMSPDDTAIIDMWNEVIDENRIPSERILNGDPLTADDAARVSEKMTKLTDAGISTITKYLTPPENELQNDKKDWRFYMTMILKWRPHGAAAVSNESFKRELAEVLYKASTDVINQKDKEILEQLAYSLNIDDKAINDYRIQAFLVQLIHELTDSALFYLRDLCEVLSKQKGQLEDIGRDMSINFLLN